MCNTSPVRCLQESMNNHLNSVSHWEQLWTVLLRRALTFLEVLCRLASQITAVAYIFLSCTEN